MNYEINALSSKNAKVTAIVSEAAFHHYLNMKGANNLKHLAITDLQGTFHFLEDLAVLRADPIQEEAVEQTAEETEEPNEDSIS